MCSHCLFPVVVTSPEQVVRRLMTVTDLLQVVPTRLIQPVRFVTSCYELVLINLLTTCYVQTISDLLEQLVASLLASSTLLQNDNNLFQIFQQLGTSIANIYCWQIERFVYTRKNAQVVKSLQTSCYKSVHKLSTSCVRTACSQLL
jgi:hypothetical protein